MRDRMTFYRRFYEAINNLSYDLQGEIYYTITQYVFDRKINPHMSISAKSIFGLIKPTLDKDEIKRQNGRSKQGDRKYMSNRIRFKVFKRDNFTCQYCGRIAPTVILEVDHINPISNGGDEYITNLITSCYDCNRGKSDDILGESIEMLLKSNTQKL